MLVVFVSGLCPAERVATVGAGGNRASPGAVRDNPAEAAENWPQVKVSVRRVLVRLVSNSLYQSHGRSQRIPQFAA